MPCACLSLTVSPVQPVSLGVGFWDRPQSRDVLSLSHSSLKAQLCKWLTAFVQNAHCCMQHRSPKHWVCAGHAMVARQQINAAHKS